MKRTRLAAAAVALAALAIPATAQAHVFVEPGEAPADGYPLLDFVVPHGCDGSPTTSLTVQFPKSVPAVTPEVEPDWEISTKEGPKDEVDLFGETITEGVSEVTWTATGEPLPDDQLLRFGAEVKLPATEGETVYFPAIQECEEGEIRWIQIPAEGETEDDLEEPAPTITLTAAEAEHGETAEEPTEAEETATEDDDEDEGAPTWLVIVALVLGALGLITGGLALARR